MATSRRARRPGWIPTLLSFGLLIVAGFGLGLVTGVVSEEPELVIGHLVGRAEEVRWQEPAALAESLPQQEIEPAPLGSPQPKASVLPAVAAPPPAPAATPNAVGFFIQVGAFGESRAAEKMAAELATKGFAARVTASADSGDQRWRVRVGPAPTRDDANRLARRLEREESLPTWVLQEGGG